VQALLVTYGVILIAKSQQFSVQLFSFHSSTPGKDTGGQNITAKIDVVQAYFKDGK